MLNGKCWIYKRATLHTSQEESIIIDYSDGTIPFDGVVDMRNGSPVYLWTIMGEIIEIPLNIRRIETESILMSGEFETAEGVVAWECIYGKFRTYPQYYKDQLLKCLPLIIVVVLIHHFMMKKGLM